MSGYGKWIGGALGWALGGPIGAVLGYSFGRMLSGGDTASGNSNGTRRAQARGMNRTGPGDFAAALVVLSAAVMKADEKILKSELDFVRTFLRNNFGPAHAEQLTQMLRDTLKRDFSALEVARQVRDHMDHSKRLLLLQYLYGIAKSDGQVHTKEVEVIREIAEVLGVSERERLGIEESFYKVKTDPYTLLEIDDSATDIEVKKAFRKLAVKYHPDKVQDLGEAYKKQAREKFISVQTAYEQIKTERGMK